MKNSNSFLILVMILIGSAAIYAQNINWVAPKSFNALKNPFKGNLSATADGKKYSTKCVFYVMV